MDIAEEAHAVDFTGAFAAIGFMDAACTSSDCLVHDVMVD